MAANHPQLSRLHIPQQGASPIPQPFTPGGLPTALQQNFALATPLNMSFGPQIPPHPQPRHGMHRAHPSLMFSGPALALAAAGIAPPSGMPMTPTGMPSHMMFGAPGFQRGSRRTPSMSTGGPPKAPLGGPKGKHSPMPAVALASVPNSQGQTDKIKAKKIILKLPLESPVPVKGEDEPQPIYSAWSRKPLPHAEAPSMSGIKPPELTSMEPHPFELSDTLPATIDVFLPGKTAWDEYYQNIIEKKLERLGVERGGNSAPPGQSQAHGRAASISSPADPALLLFKLNKLQQAQNGSISVSPQPPSSALSVSPNPQIPPRFQQNPALRHGHSFSLANFNPSAQVFNPMGAFIPFGPATMFGTDQTSAHRVSPIPPIPDTTGRDLPPHLHAPQGVVPLSLNMQSETATASSGPSRVASTLPDFNRGFGLDIPEEEEEEEEEEEKEVLGTSSQLDKIAKAQTTDETGVDTKEPEDDTTTAGAHTRHTSRVSVALSLKSIGGRGELQQVNEPIHEIAPPELENAVDWNMTSGVYHNTNDASHALDSILVDEWTGTEENASMEEYSNPSDEERAMQIKQERRAVRARQQAYLDLETPRRLPDFPRPPVGGLMSVPHGLPTTDDDIVSNPSEEGKAPIDHGWLYPGQHHQDLAYYQPVVDGQPRSPRPLPPLPHSRTASGNVSYPSTMQHSRHASAKNNEVELAPTVRRESLNPLAKPFVFGAGAPLRGQISNAASPVISHARQLSSGRALNAAAAEFKPNFTFLPPAGVPKISFPTPEVPRPLPQPPIGISPSRIQGREKRQRRESDASEEMVQDEDEDDQTGHSTMTTFRFPPVSPSTGLRAVVPGSPVGGRPISPMPQRKSQLNATARPFTFTASNTLPLPYASQEPSTLPYPLVPAPSTANGQSSAFEAQQTSGVEIQVTQDDQNNDMASDVVANVEPSPSPARRRPPVLDFRHPVSTNTVPASLFKKTFMGADLDGSTRSTVRSRLSSREIFEHMNSPSLDDTNVPTISRKSVTSQSRPTLTVQEQSTQDQSTDIFTIAKDPSAHQEQQLHVPASGIPSPISESRLSSYNRRREEEDQIEQRLEDMLDDRMELAKKDLAETHGQITDQIVGQVITAIKTHLPELTAQGFEQERIADAHGEVDFELIRNILEQGVMDIRTGLRRDLEEVLRSVESAHLARERSMTGLPADFHRTMEEFGNRTVSAVTNAVLKFAARIDQIDEFARVRASDDRESLLNELFSVLAPRLDALSQQPVDFDLVTAKLAEAVKPHISQLIDLTSDKKETAGLIVQRLMPTLSALSQTPAHVDTDAIVSQLRVELARMVPSADPHVIKEAVADLIVERLDSRLALRDKSNSSELLYSRISERIDDLHAPVSDVRRAVEDLHMGQETIREHGSTLNKLHQDMAAQLLGLPDAIDAAIEAIVGATARLAEVKEVSPSGDITQLTPQLESIDSALRKLATNHEYLVSQSANLISHSEVLETSISSLPRTLAENFAELKEAQAQFLSRNQSPDLSSEIRNLLASNAEFQVQLAKARGAHGQIRVEKDLMFDRMTIAEADRDALRVQIDELKSKNASKESDIITAGSRITELEDALSHALARLQSSEVATKAQEERIASLESQNREYGLQQYQYKSQIQKLEMQEEWLTKDKNNLEQRLDQLQKDRDSLATQQSHWQALRRTSEQVEQLTRLISAADTAEMAELKASSDRGKILEGEHASLQKRFKELESKVTNVERSSQTARQGMAQVQQRASEWEKRTKELEAELDATRARLDDADEAKLQLDSDLSLVRMHLEEKETSEKTAKELEKQLRANVSSLESQVSELQSELEKTKQTRLSAVVTSTPSVVASSPSRWGANGYANGHNARPSSRASTVYGRSPVTPTDETYRNGKFPSHAPSAAPDSPKGVWASMHAPRRPQHSSSGYPSRSSIPSPTPSTVSLAPTQGDDGWWS